MIEGAQLLKCARAILNAGLVSTSDVIVNGVEVEYERSFTF